MEGAEANKTEHMQFWSIGSMVLKGTKMCYPLH